ncbi:MAG: phytanoyl-CoA dioxygenase family protein, partial [Candidatus Latescibacteria bacterium]|nr:phytanoyl-CoA dioxygenase family protein [Candidatus Latescibacterota bacterium]
MLAQAQLDQFHRDGFAVVRQVVGGDELELLRLAADRVEADGISGRGEHHYHSLAGGTQLYYRSDQVWEHDPIFAATTAHPGLLAAVGQCLGHPFLPVAASFLCSQRFGKFPRTWHQAPPYGDRRRHTFALAHFAAGLCLDPVTTENGCFWALPGHHLAGHLNLEFGDEEELYTRARPLEMAAGDLLLLAPSAPRASRGNASPRTWRLLLLHYLARPVLEQVYPEWQTEGGGFGPQGL